MATAEETRVRGLSDELHIPRMLARCLVNRGYTTASAAGEFLVPRLRLLSDPGLLPQMDLALDRLWRARLNQEPVVVFGDYDVDGVTSTALLIEILGPLGWKVRYYLPHRLDEGYGLSEEGVKNCIEAGPVGLLVAVDCGSTSDAVISSLAAKGIDVIVLDHHQVSKPAPCAVALVNPHVSEVHGAHGTELCSAGLAFKLAHAILKRARAEGWPEAATFDLKPLLDLVALGTIADLVPLIAENRILASAGLERINRRQRPGLRALCEVAQVRDEVGTYEVAFQLAPRLNAAGRLEDATEALELLLDSDESHARSVAAALDAHNRERQAIERRIADEAIQQVRPRFNQSTDYVIVEGHLLWHVGVVGIVASRVLQEFYRPTILLGGDGHAWRGSGRSIEGFDLAEALRSCTDLLVRHGGHAMAAGVTVLPGNVPAFRTRLNALASKLLQPENLMPPLRLDAAVDLPELDLEAVADLERLRPFGQGNPAVQLVARRVRLERVPQRVGRESQHLKFRVASQGTSCDAIWWGGAARPWPEGLFDLACVPQLNTFAGQTKVQLRVLDWRPSDN